MLTEFQSEELGGKYYMEDLGVDGCIILKHVFKM
jgi:hypothetical protein